MQKIQFYREKDAHGYLSNFFASPVMVDGLLWPTTEHYFQAMKYPQKEAYREKIRADKRPTRAKALGQKPDGFRADWNEVKDDVMYKCLQAKFTQHQDLWAQLDATGDATLVEHTKRDKYWGDGGDGGSGEKGINMLGKLLMKVRTELRKSKE